MDLWYSTTRELYEIWNAYLQDPDFFAPAFFILVTITFSLFIVDHHSKMELSKYACIAMGLTIGSLMLAVVYTMNGGSPLYLQWFAIMFVIYGVTYFVGETIFWIFYWLCHRN